MLSTRTDRKAGGNAFTPVPVKLPAGPMEPAERVAAVDGRGRGREGTGTAHRRHDRTVRNREPAAHLGGHLDRARSAASRIDFATSNLRGAPFPIFVSGSEVLATIPMGPVAGTGANITALSMNGQFDIGIFADPAAITDPESFRRDVEASFADLLAACD